MSRQIRLPPGVAAMDQRRGPGSLSRISQKPVPHPCPASCGGRHPLCLLTVVTLAYKSGFCFVLFLRQKAILPKDLFSCLCPLSLPKSWLVVGRGVATRMASLSQPLTPSFRFPFPPPSPQMPRRWLSHRWVTVPMSWQTAVSHVGYCSEPGPRASVFKSSQTSWAGSGPRGPVSPSRWWREHG